MEGRNSLSWRLPFELLGAAAGLAALIYTTGAATLWLRYATTHFPADLALSVTSRERIVVIGFRLLVTWALAVSATILVVRWLSRQDSVRSKASSVLRSLRRVPAVRRIPGRALWAIVAILAVLGSAFVTWSLLTTALVTIMAVLFFRRYGFPEPSDDPSDHRKWWRLGVFIAGSAAVLGIGWQLQVNLTYDHAKLHFKQAQQDWPRVTDAVYVGQANGAYYVAPRLEKPGGPFKRALVAVSPDELKRFELLPYDQTLCTGVPRPIVSAGRIIQQLGEAVGQHLSRTGQRSPPSKPPKFTGHGHCPDP